MGAVRASELRATMKMIVLVAGTALLLAVTEASAQSRPNTRCPNSGYRGSVWCCNVNSQWCLSRAGSRQRQ